MFWLKILLCLQVLLPQKLLEMSRHQFLSPKTWFEIVYFLLCTVVALSPLAQEAVQLVDWTGSSGTRGLR